MKMQYTRSNTPRCRIPAFTGARHELVPRKLVLSAASMVATLEEAKALRGSMLCVLSPRALPDIEDALHNTLKDPASVEYIDVEHLNTKTMMPMRDKFGLFLSACTLLASVQFLVPQTL